MRTKNEFQIRQNTYEAFQQKQDQSVPTARRTTFIACPISQTLKRLKVIRETDKYDT